MAQVDELAIVQVAGDRAASAGGQRISQVHAGRKRGARPTPWIQVLAGPRWLVPAAHVVTSSPRRALRSALLDVNPSRAATRCTVRVVV